MNKKSLERKRAIETRLLNCGIKDYKITYLPYLDFNPEDFASPFETGCRLIILYAASYIAHNPDQGKRLSEWLKREDIWEHVSLSEAILFDEKVTDKKQLAAFSWHIEAAYVLAWALGLVPSLSVSCQEISDQEYDNFTNSIPLIGEETGSFFRETIIH